MKFLPFLFPPSGFCLFADALMVVNEMNITIEKCVI